MQKFEYVVVGGGIVGLSTAWTILEKKPSTRIAVVEKEERWAVHQTGRNSGVLHSGIYYKPGSLKSQLCREGNRRLQEFCNANGIRHETCGKVIVATTESELPLMGNLYQRGLANGLAVKKLSAGAVTEIEPHVSCLAGIQVPSTGIVDFVAVCQKLVELIGDRGGELHLGTEVRGLRCDSTEAVLETSKGAMAAGWIINCAGRVLRTETRAASFGQKPDLSGARSPVSFPGCPFYPHDRWQCSCRAKRRTESQARRIPSDLIRFARLLGHHDLRRVLASRCETCRIGTG